jgi:hypothetical protein
VVALEKQVADLEVQLAAARKDGEVARMKMENLRAGAEQIHPTVGQQSADLGAETRIREERAGGESENNNGATVAENTQEELPQVPQLLNVNDVALDMDENED